MVKQSARALVLLFLASAGLRAQSMNIPPSMAKPGTSGSLLLVMDFPAGKAPAAVQWKFSFPIGMIVDLKDIVAGGAAESAGKSLTCSAGAKPQKSGQTFMCILAAAQMTIPNGTVCIVRYRIPASVKWESGTVNVENIIAVGNDLQKVTMANVQGRVTTK